MPRIPVTDNAGVTIDLDLDEKSDAVRLGLAGLRTNASAFARFVDEPLDKTSFRSAALGGDYTTPQLALNTTVGFTVKAGVNTSIRLFRDADEQNELAIPVQAGAIWLMFRVEVMVAPIVGATWPSGLGVTAEKIAIHSVAVYTSFQNGGAGFPSVRDALAKTISNFRILRGASDLRAQPLDTICESEVAGKFVVEASYAYPVAVNALALASTKLPLNQNFALASDFELSLTGALAVGGEFRVRSHRTAGTMLRLGLYKQRETDLEATFTAKAGLSASIAGTDLLPPLFGALGVGNFDAAQLPEADQKAVRDSLGKAIDQGFSIALNLSCTAARTDEAAVLYEVDLGQTVGPTDAALNQALAGNWTGLETLPCAKKLKTVVTSTRETGFHATLNMLGIYDYASIGDFAKQCTILHDLETGAITITDHESAQRIAAAAEPFAADSKKLRKVLEESFLATALYTAAVSDISIGAKQNLLVYQVHQNFAELKKQMRLGVALRLLNAQDLDAITPEKDFRYYRLAASAEYSGNDALQLFFSDLASRTPRTEDDLKQFGRRVLIALLDETNPVDRARIQALQSEATWAQMEQQHFPSNSPASYSDWYDVANWSRAIAAVGPELKAVLEARASVPGDPSSDPKFMAARDALAATLAEVTRNTHAAFERGWPIAVMFALSQFRASTTFEAQWNGTKQFDKRSERVLRAV